MGVALKSCVCATALLLAHQPVVAMAQAAMIVPPPAAANPSTPILAAGTPVTVVMAQDVSSRTAHVGDWFDVFLRDDLVLAHGVIVPKGTRGRGEVTFATNKGVFGKPGILGIALRHLDLNGQIIPVDGRYREEGKNNDGAAAATMFAVGIAAVFVTGKVSVIPKGRELRARIGEDVMTIAPLVPTSAPDEAAPAPGPAPAAPTTKSE
jgi:hypothetical protein